MADEIAQYAIYDHPSDFPANFVVRELRIAGGEAVPGEYWLADTIDGARVHIPPGFVCLGRWRGDDPVIIEVWV
jgi:hypothetical protein